MRIMCLVALCLTCGCLPSGSVRIMNLETFETRSFDRGCPLCTAIVPMGMRAEHVFYLYYESDELRLAKVNLQGKLVETKALPLFSAAYGAAPDFALRPDEGAFAYYKDSSHDLCLYEFTKKVESVLVSKVAANQFRFAGVMWMDSRYLIAVMKRDYGKDETGYAVKIDTEARQVVGRVELASPSDVAISPSGQFLAVSMFRWAGLAMVDLRTMTVSVILRGDKGYIKQLAWHPDETRLAYVDGEDWLCVLTLRDLSVRRVAALPQHYVCYFLGFPRDGVCVYRAAPYGGGWWSEGSRIYFIDTRSGKPLRTMRGGHGGGHLIANGGFLVY